MYSRNAGRSTRVTLSFAAWLVLTVGAASAAPPRVEPFDIAAWERLQQQVPRPCAVVFTATYCASCPAVLEQLAAALKQRGIQGEVVAVVIDEADVTQLLKSEHYAHASRLFLFQGNEATLRYRVDPRWRGVTPYIALLPQKGTPVFTAGTPGDADIQAWLNR